MEWAGQYDQLKEEQKRLAMIVPISLVIILFLLYTTFNSLKNALLVLGTVPFALVGGVFSLVATDTNFSISAAVGVISTLGSGDSRGVLLISRIEDFRRHGAESSGGCSEGGRCADASDSHGDVGRGHRVVAGRVGDRDRIAGPKTAGPSRGGRDADGGGVDSGRVAGVV